MIDFARSTNVYIQERADWEFVAVYTDEGISALNTKHRDGFNRMVADALDGKIDLIVTKSVSRFARNTVDSLTTVRKLKEKGVEVFFEKENIYTLDSKGELLMTIRGGRRQPPKFAAIVASCIPSFCSGFSPILKEWVTSFYAGSSKV